MNLENSPDYRNNISKRKMEKMTNFYDQIKIKLAEVFDNCKESHDRVEKIKENIAWALGLLQEHDKQQILNNLPEVAGCSDKNDFVEKVFKLILPVIDLKFDKPQEMELLGRKRFIEKSGFIELNKLLCYEIQGTKIFLHVAPNEATPLADKIFLFNDGIRKLASLVANNSKITQIIASSWIVAKHKKFLQKVGFVFDHVMDQKEKKRHFGIGEKRDVGIARISREVLLEKYL